MKKTKHLISNIMIFALFVISCTVATGLIYHKDMWKLIVAYWVTLTVKNAIDYFFNVFEE